MQSGCFLPIRSFLLLLFISVPAGERVSNWKRIEPHAEQRRVARENGRVVVVLITVVFDRAGKQLSQYRLLRFRLFPLFVGAPRNSPEAWAVGLGPGLRTTDFWSSISAGSAEFPCGRLERYAALHRPNDLIVLEVEDQFVASILPLGRVRYAFRQPEENYRRYGLDFRQLGIALTVDGIPQR